MIPSKEEHSENIQEHKKGFEVSLSVLLLKANIYISYLQPNNCKISWNWDDTVNPVSIMRFIRENVAFNGLVHAEGRVV